MALLAASPTMLAAPPFCSSLAISANALSSFSGGNCSNFFNSGALSNIANCCWVKSLSRANAKVSVCPVLCSLNAEPSSKSAVLTASETLFWASLLADVATFIKLTIASAIPASASSLMALSCWSNCFCAKSSAASSLFVETLSSAPSTLASKVPKALERELPATCC